MRIVGQPRYEILGRQICPGPWPHYATIPLPIAWRHAPDLGIEDGVLGSTQIEEGCDMELKSN